MPGKIMQGRPEGGGSIRNGLLHSRPLPRKSLNARPQAFPTLVHCPGSSQHHNPPDYLRQEVGQSATGATAEAELPPTRAAPECGQPE
jgi:hypothetical protein